MSDVVLSVETLVKDYGKFRAVDSISFDVKKGTIVGFLGPNGAGKTTTIQILLGITSLTTGSIKYFGKDFHTNREECLQKINFTSAFNTLQGRISVWENLLVFANLYNVNNYREKISTLIEYFEVPHILHQRYYDLSAGQKTRVNLIKSLLNDPELILMDEPTASLDPDIADKTLSLIENLKLEKNITILYTSHNMDEITRVCDEVIFLDHGRIVAQDTPKKLVRRIGKADLELTIDDNKAKVQKFLNENKYNHKFRSNNTVNIQLHESEIPNVLYEISHLGVVISSIEIKKPNLEDVFLEIARSKK